MFGCFDYSRVSRGYEYESIIKIGLYPAHPTGVEFRIQKAIASTKAIAIIQNLTLQNNLPFRF